MGSASVDYDVGDPGLAAWSPNLCRPLPEGWPQGLCDWIVTLRAVDVVWQFDHTNAPANPDVGVYRVASGTLQWSVTGVGQTPGGAECDFSGSGTESLVVDEPTETGSFTLTPTADQFGPERYFGEATIGIHGQITGCGGVMGDPNLTVLCNVLGSPGGPIQVPGSCGQWFNGDGTPVLSDGVWALEELYPTTDPPGTHHSWSFSGTAGTP